MLLLVVSLHTTPIADYSNPIDPLESPAAVAQNENAEPAISRKNFKQKSTALWQFLVAEKVIVVILFGYFLRMLSVSVSRLFLLYIAKRFDWSFAKVCLLSSKPVNND